VALGAAIMARFEHGDLHGPKGPVLQTAIIAGTMAVKNTSTLIPFCHPLPVEQCDFETTPDATGLTLRCTVATTGKTGVEMEAMTGASVAALTLYDMAKALHKGIRIENLHFVSKTGGKSGDYRATTCCGLLLAGGRSARMGTDKAALRHPDGRTLARRAYDLLLEAGCETIVLSLRHDQELPPGLEGLAEITVVRDPVGRSEGPLTGMITGMALRPDADWLVLATDLPPAGAAHPTGAG
jgi:cyclic pyranopterin phosphate synthase